MEEWIKDCFSTIWPVPACIDQNLRMFVFHWDLYVFQAKPNWMHCASVFLGRELLKQIKVKPNSWKLRDNMMESQLERTHRHWHYWNMPGTWMIVDVWHIGRQSTKVSWQLTDSWLTVGWQWTNALVNALVDELAGLDSLPFRANNFKENMWFVIHSSVLVFVQYHAGGNLSFQFLEVFHFESYLVENNVFPYESQQFEPFKYIRRCVHTHVFYLKSEK